MRHFPSALVIAFCLATVEAKAGLSAPIPSARLSEDEGRILVLRHDGDGYSGEQVENPRLSNGEEIDFLKLFSHSGVYLLPERELVYGIDWFCLDYELLASGDLRHIARMNRFGNDWALKFYEDGEEIRSFTTDQLLTAFAGEQYRSFVTWDYFHPWVEEFDLYGGQIVVTTVNRQIARVPIGYYEVHTFDLASGKLLDTDIRNGRFRALVTGFGGFFIILTTTLILAARAKRNKTGQKTQQGMPR